MTDTIAQKKDTNRIVSGAELNTMEKSFVENTAFVCPFCGIKATPHNYENLDHGLAYFEYDDSHGETCEIHNIPLENRSAWNNPPTPHISRLVLDEEEIPVFTLEHAYDELARIAAQLVSNFGKGFGTGRILLSKTDEVGEREYCIVHAVGEAFLRKSHALKDSLESNRFSGHDLHRIIIPVLVRVYELICKCVSLSYQNPVKGFFKRSENDFVFSEAYIELARLIMLITGSFAEGVKKRAIQLFKFNRPIEHEHILSPAEGEALLAKSLELELSGKELDKNIHYCEPRIAKRWRGDRGSHQVKLSECNGDN